ncbi:MAG: hypothetical protein HYV52_00640, partial [Parcubacteria group bacterium]|nr:hypothetical protein [Parcubacteria group bacterium]
DQTLFLKPEEWFIPIKNDYPALGAKYQRLELSKTPMNKAKTEALASDRAHWLALLNDFRTFDWAEEYKYPTVILAQMNQLLAECRDDQPAVAP